MHKLQREEMENALNKVWQAIGADVLAMCENNTASKSEVIEMVMDANRMDMFGDLGEDGLLFWNGLNHKTQKRIANSAFEYNEYGY